MFAAAEYCCVVLGFSHGNPCQKGEVSIGWSVPVFSSHNTHDGK